MKSWIAAASAVLILAASPAAACSLSDWNRYESWFEPSIIDLTRRAATIDFVQVERTELSVDCPRPGTDMTRDEARTYLNESRAIPGCDPHGSPAPGTFEGVVIERLKGSSPDVFSLFMRSSWNQREEMYGFSDPAHRSREAEGRIEAAARREADTRRNGPDYWSNPVARFQEDGSNSCGGYYTVVPDMTYVVFRDDDGAILALEPAWQDDELLRRLRLRRDDPTFDLRDSREVNVWIAGATDIAVVKINYCEGQGTGNYEDEKAAVSQVRGEAAFIYQYNEAAGGWESGQLHPIRFDDLPDFFEWRGQPCPAEGSHVLVLRFEMSGWPIPLMPIPVSADGVVNRADIPTALRLTGPETFSVDQAFQWFEAGQMTAP
jgi:hypothetical protein